MFCFGEVTF